ncbi:MAG: hypothetical protein JNL30_05820 [Rubrivivax sp.]|nr:hypothetical protein [Rubrivivax sp.]
MPKIVAARFIASAQRRLALAAVVVLAALAFPLGETWRRLGLEHESTLAARRGLEPARLASQAQQALSVHRPLAAAVLAGARTLEPERLRLQRMVDEQLVSLSSALESRRLARALTENDQLRHDWLALLEDIGARRLTPVASNAAHQLLIEQTFVIADLAATDSRLHSHTGRAFDGHAFALATHALPRLALALAPQLPEAVEAPEASGASGLGAEPAARAAAAATAAFSAGAEAEVGRAARAVAHVLRTSAERAVDLDELQRLLALQGLLDAASAEPGASGASGPTSTPAPGAARAPAAWSPASPPAPPARQALREAALRATEALLLRLDRDLGIAAETLAAERRIVGAALGLDALLLLLAAALMTVRDPRRKPPAPPHAEAAAPASDWVAATTRPAGAESEAPAAALLRRVRHAAHDPDSTLTGGIGPR